MSISSRFSGHVSLQARHASFAHAILLSASFIVSGIASSCCALGTFPFTPRSNHRGQNSSTRPKRAIIQQFDPAELPSAWKWPKYTDMRSQPPINATKPFAFLGFCWGPFNRPGSPASKTPGFALPHLRSTRRQSAYLGVLANLESNRVRCSARHSLLLAPNVDSDLLHQHGVAHCLASVSLLPITRDAKLNCGLRYSWSRGGQYGFCIREAQTYEIIGGVARPKNEVGALCLSGVNESVIRKALRKNNLDFHRLFLAQPHVFACLGRPLTSRVSARFEDLKSYPCDG